MQLNSVCKLAAGAMLSAAAAVAATAAIAQSYPSKPVHVIVPYPPGTGVDVITRDVLQVVSNSVGQPFIFETRTGAAGTIAVNYVAKSQPDGYTIVTNSAAHTAVPFTVANLPFDTARDLAAITTLADLPLVLIVNKDLNVHSVKELVAAAKAKPGTFYFASGGIGSTAHLAAEKLALSSGFQATHVPFSSVDGVPDVMGGRIQFMYTAVVTALPGISDGRLVPIAMSSRRTAALPNVPIIAEAGFPNSGYDVWLGIFGPAKMPREAVNKIYQEVVKAEASKDLLDHLAKVGAEPSTTAPDAFDAQIKKELTDNAELTKKLGITPK